MELLFLYPSFAVLLLLIPAVWFFRHRRITRVHGIIRSIIILILVLAMTHPVIIKQSDQFFHVIVFDQSQSVDAEAVEFGRQKAQALLAETSPKDVIKMFRLGGDELGQLNQKNNHAIEDVLIFSSSLSKAVTEAIQAIPLGANGKVSVISDGLSTDANWERALYALKEREIKLDSYILPPKNDVAYIASAQFSETRAGHTSSAEIVAVGTGGTYSVVLKSSDQELKRTEPIFIDGRTLVRLDFDAGSAGFLPLEIYLEATSPASSKVRAEPFLAMVAVQDPIRTLYLSGKSGNAQSHLAALVGAGFDVLSAPVSAIGSIDFNDFDLVIQDDLPASDFTENAQRRLANSVSDMGVGLIHSGGENAFGLGGYGQSKIAEMLPVEFKHDMEEKDPSVALAIVVDTSSSMMGKPIELAKEVVRLAYRGLKAHDQIGIVEFYGTKHWSVPMQSASNTALVERAIGRMKALGGTELLPAVEEAYFGLRNAKARYKHLLVITDAFVERENYEQLVRHMSKNNVTVSTFLAGDNEDTGGVLADIATWGKGRFYKVDGAYSMVDLSFRQPKQKKLEAYRKGSFYLSGIKDNQWWGDVGALPEQSLNGYVRVKAKGVSETIAYEKASAHPLVSSWQYGLGRSTAIMFEPTGRGTSNWKEWSDYGKWLASIMGHTANTQPYFDIKATLFDNAIDVLIEVLDPSLDIFPVLNVVNPEDYAIGREVMLSRKAPGLYAARFPFNADKNLLLQISGGNRVQRLAVTPGDFVYDELYVDPQEVSRLAQLSAYSGGESLRFSDGAFGNSASTSKETNLAAYALMPLLMLLALFIYLSEIIYRRWPGRAV